MTMEEEGKELQKVKKKTEEEDKKLAEVLLPTANELLSHPSSVEPLLHVLQKLENILLQVEQSPSNTLQKALRPGIKALATKTLLNHENMDVKVHVASCLCEIMRINAPDSPYGDEHLPEIFKQIVAAFDDISDISSNLYQKRVSILQTFKQIKLWLVMLDIECDSLILEMFNNFLRNIRENHPEFVFMSMGFIMIMVLEEIKEVPLDLLSALLGSVRNDNQNVLPIARKLSERVLQSCASKKLATYMHQAVELAGFPLDKYSEIVRDICARYPNNLENDGILSSQDNSTEKHLICLAPEKKKNSGEDSKKKNSGEDSTATRVKINKPMREKKRRKVDSNSLTDTSVKQGNPTEKFDAKESKSGTDTPKKAENRCESDTETPKECMKLKDDPLKPRAPQQVKDTARMGEDEDGKICKVVKGVLPPLVNLVPPRLKKLRTRRRGISQAIIQFQDNLGQLEQSSSH